MTDIGYQTLIEPISERARREPTARVLTLIGDDGTSEHLTTDTLHQEAQAYGRGLQRAGVGTDDVVILAIGQLRPLIGAFLGALHIGAVPTVSSWATDRLDPAVHRSRISALVRASGARAVVSAAERSAPLEDTCAEIGCRVLRHEDLNMPGTLSAARRTPGDIAFLQYSSGTAGGQKGVPNTHRAVLCYLDAKRRTWSRPHAVLVSWLPLYHDLGLVSGLLAPLVLGVHGVLMSPQHWVRDPKILLRAIHEYHGTVCYMPNFAFNHCVHNIRDRDLKGVELGHWDELLSGGEPVRADSLRLFAERFAPFGFRASALRTGYGMAEMVEGVSCSPPGELPRVDWIDQTQLYRDHRAAPAPPEQAGSLTVVSCGVPNPGIEFRVIDDAGATLPDRGVGEILIRGPYMFGGYFRQPEHTTRAIRDGWFHSGDLGYLVAGQIYITGRKTDLIIVGGRNVHPEDIERVADTITGLLPGRSVAFGLPDARSGSERIAMVCEVPPACDADQKLVLARELRRRVTQELGVTLGDLRLVGRGWVRKTSSGKIARPDNRRRFLEEFAADQPSAAGGASALRK